MRKQGFVALLLAVALVLVPLGAWAEVNMGLFDQAKSALSYISYGEYAKALKKMGLDSGKDAAKKLKSTVSDGLSSALYGEVQTEVAVCYKVQKGYKLCVPVEDPTVGEVEVLIMQSRDGESFSGYRVGLWSDCTAEAAKSSEVVWCEAEGSADPFIVVD